MENNDKLRTFDKITKEMLETYSKKNHDYGDSFGETFKKFGLISAVIRISDKVNRLVSLSTKDAKVDESLEDTLLDLASYSVMTLIELKSDER